MVIPNYGVSRVDLTRSAAALFRHSAMEAAIAHKIDAIAAKYIRAPKKGLPARRWLARRFSKSRSGPRLLICYNMIETAPAQVFPFFYYAEEIQRRFHAEVRCVPFSEIAGAQVSSGSHRPLIEDASVILIQPWFTEPSEIVQQTIDNLYKTNPSAEISFLDSFAHSDVRAASYLKNNIRFYIKKSLFVDTTTYGIEFLGGNILEDFYSKLYGIAADRTNWNFPLNFVDKLRLSPNFLTAARFIEQFESGHSHWQAERPIDLQARIGAIGTAWYQTMRIDAIDRVQAIRNIKASPTNRVDLNGFMAELYSSKLCFSPFGYGELCWRDIEAMATGAILIKPSMAHLRSAPSLYEEGITYLPCRWDFADLEDVVHHALSNYATLGDIAMTAQRRCAEYLKNAKFVDDIAFLFNGP